MTWVRTGVALAWWLALALGVAQSEGRVPDARPDAPRAVSDALVTERLGEDAVAWLQQMFASERAFAFAAAPDERSTWPAAAAAAHGGFAWPAGATLELVRTNFDVRWVGRERSAGRAVVVVDLVPRHDGPGWRFWIDVATGARVAYRAALADGRVVAEGRGDPTALVPTPAAEALRAPRAPGDARASLWNAAFAGLDGFEPVAVGRVRLGDDVHALRVTLWDGLSGVVLLVYPAARTPARGEMIVTRSTGGLTLALVGPVPQAAAEAYLDALAERRWARADLGRLLRQWAPGDVDDDASP